jgi:succinyl-diaminopimelate desuccinylase
MNEQIDYSKYIPQMIEDIQNLVRIPSIRDDKAATPDAPYGPQVRAALDFMHDIAERDGLKVGDAYPYAVYMQGQNNSAGARIDVVSHVDVVPVGTLSNWQYEPFGAEIDEDRMYGRGTSDMKRNAIISYYAARILQDYQIPTKNTIRIVIGSDEESDMSDIPHYVAKEGAPDFAITPDGTFPLQIGEKGATTWEYSGHVTDTIVESVHGGAGSNVVPSEAHFVLAAAYKAELSSYAADKNYPIEVAETDGKTHLTVFGISAHASTPEAGDSALTRGFDLIATVYGDTFAQRYVNLFRDYYGSGFDIAREHDVMGPLTVNQGVFDKEADGTVAFTIDIRYPENITEPELSAAFAKAFPALSAVKPFDTPPILSDVKLPANQLLLKTFADHYPDHSLEPIISGGVSYSKVMPNCVSFGMNFQDDVHVAHQANEYIELTTLTDLLQLFTDAFIRLGQADTLK